MFFCDRVVSASIYERKKMEKLIQLSRTADGQFEVGKQGVVAVETPADRKVEFVAFEDERKMAYVKSTMGYPAYYPVHDVKIEKPLQAVLMDLDGTTVHSEHFWIWIIEKTTASLLSDPKFKLEACDEPHVSGHSVSEHLQYCVNKYCADKTVEEARQWYFRHTNFEMNEIMEGRCPAGSGRGRRCPRPCRRRTDQSRA